MDRHTQGRATPRSRNSAIGTSISAIATSQSDSVVDGFNDSDFGAPLTGTNLKGYTVGGDLALGRRVWLGLHFMSADSIIGPPFKSRHRPV